MKLNQSTKTLLMTARLRKVQTVWLTVFGHAYAIYKLIDNTFTNLSERPSIVLKLWRPYPFMYQINKGHNSVKIELVTIFLVGHV